jgi:hypothetical protein
MEAAAPFHFWAAAYPAGGGTPNMAFVFDAMGTTAPAEDTDPYTLYLSGSNGFLETDLCHETKGGCDSVLSELTSFVSPFFVSPVSIPAERQFRSSPQPEDRTRTTTRKMSFPVSMLVEPLSYLLWGTRGSVA